MKSKIPFWYIILILLFSCRKDAEAPAGPHFSVSPLPLANLARISQLGENGKIFPVSHTYWTTCDDGFLILPSGNPCTLDRLTIVAPGNGRVVDIVHAQDGEVSFEGPAGLRWTFAHVTPAQHLTLGDEVTAGDMVATMTYDFSFDFGVFNPAVEHHYVSSREYPGVALHGQHPIEQYAEPLRSQLMEKLVGEKQLGKLSYDIAGTASGGWIREDAPDEVFVVGNERYFLWMGRLAERNETRIVNIGERWPGQPEAFFTDVVDTADLSWEEITPESGPVQLRLWQMARSGFPNTSFPMGSLLVELEQEEIMRVEWFDTHNSIDDFTDRSRLYLR